LTPSVSDATGISVRAVSFAFGSSSATRFKPSRTVAPVPPACWIPILTIGLPVDPTFSFTNRANADKFVFSHPSSMTRAAPTFG
jgi:hypothetical protein